MAGIFRLVRRAAFDIGSGSSKICIADVSVSLDPLIPSFLSKIHYQIEVPVALGADFYKSKNAMLSDAIQDKGVEVVTSLYETAKKYEAVEFSGVATEIFRKAANGAQYLEKLRSIGIKIDIVSQDLEALLGNSTAVALDRYSNNSSLNSTTYIEVSETPIVWDSGGASFQITKLKNDNLLKYCGRLGSSVAVSELFKVRSVDFAEGTLNPISELDSSELIIRLKDQMPDCPDWLFNSDRVLSLAGRNSLFRLACDILSVTSESKVTKFRLTDAKVALAYCLSKQDSDLVPYLPRENADPASYIVPKLSLLIAVMEKTGVKLVETIEAVGSCPGILVSREFWNL